MADMQKYINQFRDLNPRDVGTWQIVPRLATMLGIVVVLVGAGWYFYWNDQIDHLHSLQSDEVKLKSEYRDKLQQAVNLEPLRKEREIVSQYVFRLEKQLPSKAEMDALLSDINQAGVGRGLLFNLFRPGAVAVRQYYAELPIAISVTGSYHDLGAFTSDLASLPRIVTLNNLQITLGPGNTTSPLTMEAIIKTFRYLDPGEQAAQASQAPAAPKKGGAK